MSDALTPGQVREWGIYAKTSPLYARLVEVVADDGEMMRVLNSIEHTPKPNMLFAGVQYLMHREGGEELAEFYPNFSSEPRDVAGVDDVFRAFVLSHESDLIEVGRTRYTQTNECGRCVALVPAIWLLPTSRFHLIDLGASAGLNLRFDAYHYRWGDTSWGPDSAVELRSESRGAPIIPRDLTVLSRTGLDLDPVDPGDPDSRLWLEALIWPEHHERRDRLVAALDLASRIPAETRAGDGLETLGPSLDDLPADEPTVVINSFVLNQFSVEQRAEVAEIIAKARLSRQVYRVSLESIGRDDGTASLEIDVGSGLHDVGQAWPHGDWVEIYARP